MHIKYLITLLALFQSIGLYAQSLRNQLHCSCKTDSIVIYFDSFLGDSIEVYANNIMIFKSDSLYSIEETFKEKIVVCVRNLRNVDYTVRYREVFDKASYMHGYGGTWNKKLPDTEWQEINFKINHADEGRFLIVFASSGPQTIINEEYMLVGYLTIEYAVSKNDDWEDTE